MNPVVSAMDTQAYGDQMVKNEIIWNTSYIPYGFYEGLTMITTIKLIFLSLFKVEHFVCLGLWLFQPVLVEACRNQKEKSVSTLSKPLCEVS